MILNGVVVAIYAGAATGTWVIWRIRVDEGFVVESHSTERLNCITMKNGPVARLKLRLPHLNNGGVAVNPELFN